MSNIFKDCGEIWNRLFDHRPFLSGEILYFHEEFELKRSDREISKLFEILEVETEICDSKINRLINISKSGLPNCDGKLNTALSTCSAILEKESKFNLDLKNLEEANREIKKNERERIENEMRCKYENINKTFEEKERELIAFYSDLEKKLHIEDSQVPSKN